MLELTIVLLLILANGLFAGAEIAILTAGKGEIAERARRGDRKALAVQALREYPERFLATVQIGITVVGSAAAVFGGARIAKHLEPVFTGLGFGTHAEQAALITVVLLVSFLALVLGELVPKSLALRYAKGYALAIARPLLVLARLARPLVWFLTACSNALLRLFGDRTSFTETRLSREELRELVAEAGRTGSLDAHASQIASRALEYGEIAVAEVMVPRDRIVGLRRDASHAELQRVLLEEGHSRMPVYDGELDRITGYVVARDLLAVAWQGSLIVLDDIVRPVVQVAATARVGDVLRRLQRDRVQIAIVRDEHGAVQGLVTIEDLVEELVGDIFGEHDDDLLVREPAGTVLVPGWVPIRKVNRALDLALPIGRDSLTIAGLCMSIALAIPGVGARVRATDGTVLEVVDASPRRIRTVRIHRRPARVDGPDTEPPARS